MAGTSDTSARVLSELGIDASSHAHHLVRPVSLPCALPQLLRTPLGSGGAALLDSAMIDEHLGRWSFLAPRPRWVAGIYRRPDGALLTIEGPHKRRRRVHLPGCRAFDLLGRIIRAARMPAGGVPERCVVPFIGGLVGYLGYELLHDLERVPELPADDLGLPDCMLAICDTIVALDHIERRAFLSTIGRGGDDGSARRRAQRQLDAGSARLAAVDIDAADRAKARAKRPPAAGPCGADADHWRCSLTAAAYRRAVETIRERIAAGDLYQANLTMRMSAPFMDDPAALYELLRQVNPAPFAGLLRFPGLAVVSSSPERFLRLDASGRVETRPIKGTCPRGADPQADRALRVALQRSEKDRAEHVMIVDLLRNDLGRVCRFGSVRVPEVLRIEEYARVFQMVSAVVGRLNPGHDVVDLLRAAFPGGSMTGAPKVAATRPARCLLRLPRLLRCPWRVRPEHRHPDDYLPGGARVRTRGRGRGCRLRTAG